MASFVDNMDQETIKKIGALNYSCGKKTGGFDHTTIKGVRTIESLLEEPFDKHVGSFELPAIIKGLMDVDQINAIITWYVRWKLTSTVDKQTTCTVIDEFGYVGGTKAIIAINIYKYLRNKGYDPDFVEKFLNK